MKLVIIIDHDLPLGLIANTAAALSLSLGNRIPGLIGPDTLDKEGTLHLGITQINIPVLGATASEIKTLREKLLEEAFVDITTIDFSTVAQRSKSYDDYIRLIGDSGLSDLEYLGICLYGPVKKINRLTGNLQLLK